MYEAQVNMWNIYALRSQQLARKKLVFVLLVLDYTVFGLVIVVGFFN